MNSKFDAVLFDFDGTVADTGRGIFTCVKYAANFYGWPIPSDDILRTFIGPPLHDSFRDVFQVSEEQALAAVEKYRELYGDTGMLMFDLYDGMEDIIKDIRSAGTKLAIATSKPDRFIHRILAYAGIENQFDYISAPLDKNGDTSKAQLIKQTLDTLCVSKEQTVMIGDRCYDIEGAKKAGVMSIGITWGYGSEEELTSSGADYIVHSVDELHKIIFG